MATAVPPEVCWTPMDAGEGVALTTTRGRAQIVFGQGPARGAHDPHSRVAQLLRVFSRELAGIRWCEQIHSAILASLSSGPQHPLVGAACVGRGDGLLTAEPGLALLVWTADCVPVVIVGGEAVAVLHAGWRGCAQDILGRGLRRLELEYGLSPAHLEVFLGPSIAACHYQVGSEVIDALSEHVPDARPWMDRGRVDLRRFLVARALLAGISRSSIHRVGACTACTPELASYRRDGPRAGRQWSLAFLVPAAVAAPLS